MPGDCCEPGQLVIRGAREHNLKGFDLSIPRGSLTVITGLSGSGKSSLAFDTIYAEGQRRYVESLSAYARQFLSQMQKPRVELIEGLSPAISIEQRTATRNPRSTVGTATEIYDYLRLLYARVGRAHCHQCGREISRLTVDQMADRVLALDPGKRVHVEAPMVRGKKGQHRDVLARVERGGFVRVRVDGETMEVHEVGKLAKNKKHDIDVIVDRLVLKNGVRQRLVDSLETALELTDGLVVIEAGKEQMLLSATASCAHCGIGPGEIEPRMFSFNSPYGACQTCGGLGTQMRVERELIVPNPAISLRDGAVSCWPDLATGWARHKLDALSEYYGFGLMTPFKDLPEHIQEVLLRGSGDEKIEYKIEFEKGRWEYVGGFEGAIPNLERRYRETKSENVRRWIEGFMAVDLCPVCAGARLRPEALAVSVGELPINEVTAMSVKQCVGFFDGLSLTGTDKEIAEEILKEIRERLGFLANVGLDYLTLDRSSGTLSGGEAQRIRLATQIGTRLVGVLYILDEPSIGLHQHDNAKLLKTLIALRDIGNTVIVVEHDEETIRSADWVVDLGPGAGRNGGHLVASCHPDDLPDYAGSITGRYLSGKESIELPAKRRPNKGPFLRVVGARENNLANIDVEVPLSTLTCVTGVSGSGKSTLVSDIIHRALAEWFHRARKIPGKFDRIEGLEHIDKVVNISQSPIGRTPRSNPVTYTGTFVHIRQLLSKVPEARARGYRPGRFSFNVRGGRCEACQGGGQVKIEMHVLPDVFVTCEACAGQRFNRETLDITYKGKNIADILEMTVDEALDFFSSIPMIKRKLKTLHDVGLGYVGLGQPATTLSGGEAQRIKLASELSRRSTGRTLYILDEPTTGLHFHDVKMLLEVLGRLVDKGNTVLVIEHNMDVVKTSDHIIDLGPKGGDEGGRVIVAGTPEEVAAKSGSYTGEVLARVLKS
ncbi:MAG: excinuclease ABC subunit UvrA [Candidatus Eisenbacteria bacterium]